MLFGLFNFYFIIIFLSLVVGLLTYLLISWQEEELRGAVVLIFANKQVTAISLDAS